MKSKKLFMMLMLFVLVLIVSVACTGVNDAAQGGEETVTEAGVISGNVIFSNADSTSNGGIIVSLDKTDGLRTVAVLRSAAARSIVPKARSIVANTTTSSNGSYIFENLEPGTYTVYAASTYSSERAVYTNVVVRAAETTVAETLKLTATGSISGRITTDYKTSGNTGFLVFVAGTSWMAMTDDSGYYTISGVPAGKGYQVVATKNGVIHNLSSNVTVTANGFSAMADNNFTTGELDNAIQGEKGDTGADGKDGKNGISMVWLGAYESAGEIENPEYLNAYFNMTDGCSYIYTGTEWTLLARSGANGVNGSDGVSIIWKGELLTAPENPRINWAYYNTEAGCSYIWNGTKWDLLSKAGADGQDGGDGKNGTNGIDGVSIIWKGELFTAPENPRINWAYYNTEAGCSYIWNGTKWDLLSKAGADGQ
ncbi:MAG: carboxypeptidase regulatory-like domain-containing protein, partial [Treponema sp.]|nr:carboxypeptidase regulatory-like domain-containing protein [Treponema sp.]